MTESMQSSENQNQSFNSESTLGAAPVVSTETQEKMLKQSEVNELIGRAKHDSYQKGKSEALTNLQAQQTPPMQQPSMPNYQPQAPIQQHVGGMPQMTPEQIRQMIVDENQRTEQARYYSHVSNSFVSKMNAGSGKYSDFDAVVNPLNLPQIPEIWLQAESFDNPADIMYELGKDPGKLAQLRNLAYSPALVKVQMQKLSDSLKQNDAAAQQKKPNAPLSRQQPSNIGTDNAEMSVEDWRRVLKV